MEKNKSFAERRKDLRLNMLEPLFINLHIAKKKGLLFLQSKKHAPAENISAGGILLELPSLNQKQLKRILEGQDKIMLEMSIPLFKRAVKIPAKIIWIGKVDKRGKTVYIAGVSFTDIKEEDREKLLPFLIGLCLKGKANII